ncbi:MAG: DUF2378 family protein [Myxococcaceae bacterium]
MTAGVVFKHTVESFVSNVIVRGGLLNDAAWVAATRARGLDLTRPADTNLDDWMWLVEHSATALNPGASREDAMRDIGRRVFDGFARSVVGVGMVLVMRLLGPRRTLLQIMDSYRNADSVTKVKVTEVSPKHLRLEFNTVGGSPTYVEGLFRGVFSALRVEGAQVRWALTGDGGGIFDVTWP